MQVPAKKSYAYSVLLVYTVEIQCTNRLVIFFYVIYKVCECFFLRLLKLIVDFCH